MKKLLIIFITMFLLTGCNSQDTFKNKTILTDSVMNISVDVSKQTVNDVQTIVLNEFNNKTINLYQNNEIVDSIKFSDLNLNTNIIEEIEKCKNLNNDTKDIEFHIDYDITRENIENILPNLNCFTNYVEPQDAYISKDNLDWEIISEVNGNKLKKDEFISFMLEELLLHKTEIYLDDANLYEKPNITKENKELQQKVKTYNKYVNMSFTYLFGEQEVELTKEILSSWLNISDTNKLIFNEELMLDYILDLADNYNTFAESILFTTSNNITVEVPAGDYGWLINVDEELKELKSNIEKAEDIKREPIWKYKGYGTYDDGAPSNYIEISIRDQKLWLYLNYDLVLETNIVTGNESKKWGTPSGIFGLTYKTRNATLRGADYETPVSYWMPFNGNIGMHDATWRGTFGNDIYLTNGSHGCVNLPLEKAKEIYNYIDTNFPIIVYDYEEDTYQ